MSTRRQRIAQLSLLIVAAITVCGYVDRSSWTDERVVATPAEAASRIDFEPADAPSLPVVAAPSQRGETPSRDSSSPSAFCVRVVDESAAAITDAEVHVRRDGSWKSIGRTGIDGRCALDRPEPSSPVELAVVADPYVPHRNFVEPSAEDEVVVVLRSGTRICGEVRLASGAIPTGVVEVLAIERSTNEGPSILDRRDDGDPTIRRAHTDSNGGFCVTRLAPDACYDVFCGGSGYAATAGTFHSCVTPGSFVRLEVVKLVAATIEFADPVRGRVQPGHGSRTLEAWCEGAAFQGLSPSTWLSGLDSELRRAPKGWLVYVFGLPDERSEPTFLRLDHEFAGYSAGVEQLECKPADAPTPHYAVTLQALEGPRGWVEVEFELGEGRGETPRFPHTASLELRTREGSRFAFELDDLVDGRTSVANVPVGEYFARLHAPPFAYPRRSLDGLPLVVRENQHARFTAPYASAGSVQFELFDTTGAPYRGAVMVLLAHEPGDTDRPNARRMVLMRSIGWPHVVHGLEPQTYLVRLESPTFRDRAGNSEWRLDVRSGESTSSEAVLAR